MAAASASADALVEEAVDAYLSLGATGDPVALLARAALADPPREALPRALTAALFALSTGTVARLAPVAAARAAAAAAVRARRAAPREAALALAAEALLAGRWRFAAQVLEARLAAAPVDALLLRLCHDVYFFLGDSRGLRDGVGRAFQAWEPTTPRYGRVCGMLAFGLEETGAYERAEELAMTALTLDPADAWAVHAATHVFEMGARREEGERLLRDTEEHWRAAALFARHIDWHWGLFALAAGGATGYRQAAARYDAGLSGLSGGASGGGAPAADDPARLDPLALVDATALLWRMQLQHHALELLPPLPGVAPPSAEPIPRGAGAGAGAGAGVGAVAPARAAEPKPFTRWSDLAERWAEALAPQLSGAPRAYAFNDVHAAMALAAARFWGPEGAGESGGAAEGFDGELGALLQSVRRFAGPGGGGDLGEGAAAVSGDAWLRELVARDGYDLAALGLGPGCGHGHSSAPVLLLLSLQPPDVAAAGEEAPFAPHLPLAALSDNWAATAAVGADLAEAVAHFARGGAAGFRRAFSLLSATRPRWQLVGGSHAQRDVFEQTLLFAAVGCGELDAARALAAERLVVRPNDGAAWYVFGSVLRRAGERERAADAFNRAYVLGLAQGPQY